MAEANATDHFRLFVAIPVPEDVKTAIEKAQRELRRSVSGGVIRWAGREQFHLTLKFLGNVEIQRVGQLAASLREACRHFPTLPLRAERIGFFPQPRAPRVVWVGVQDRQARLPELQRAVEAAVAGFTDEEPEQRFAGHITLARIKAIHRHEAEGLTQAATTLGALCFGEWTAEKVELMRSELSPKGARYTSLESLPLTPEQCQG